MFDSFDIGDYELIRLEIFWVSLVGIWLLYGLFAFWVSGQSWHWFLKFAMIAAAVSLPRIIGASDLMLMQLASCLTIFLLHTGWRTFLVWRNRSKDTEGIVADEKKTPRQSNRWSIANLLWATAAIATIVSLLNVDMTGLATRTRSLSCGLLVGSAFTIGMLVGSIRSWWSLIFGVIASSVAMWLTLATERPAMRNQI